MNVPSAWESLFKQFAQHALTSAPCFRIWGYFPPFRVLGFGVIFGKISAHPHSTLCIQFLDRENNDKNNTLPSGKQICLTIVWGCAEILPHFPPFRRSAVPAFRVARNWEAILVSIRFVTRLIIRVFRCLVSVTFSFPADSSTTQIKQIFCYYSLFNKFAKWCDMRQCNIIAFFIK